MTDDDNQNKDKSIKITQYEIVCRINIIIFLLYLLQSISYAKLIEYKLIDNKQPLSIIHIDPDNYNELYAAAEELQKYIHKSTGIRLPFKHELASCEPYPVCIHLTINHNSNHNFLIEKLRASDGFHIDLSVPDHIWIRGNSASGTEYGVYEFLERFVGIRWLFPGESGEHIPKRPTLMIKSQDIKQIPAFATRQLSGLSNTESQKWAHRQRMKGGIQFHHNLHNIFPVKKYSKTYPHLYPQKNGNVVHDRVGWQPCFQEKNAVRIAVAHIINYFENNQTMHTFSLGTNDAITATSGYCHHDIEPGGLNMWGYPNASNVYYEWANSVVSKVLKRFPDKIFGTLAYMEAAMPPDKLMLNDHIIPFLTEDRLRWVNAVYEQKAKKWVNDWQKKANYIGFYDYFYGTPYVLPRVYFHHMADIYKFAQQSGVSSVYAEAYPNWGEGPKLYLALKLFWNPKLDTDELLDDWYTCCVGKRAAMYLSQYFQIWESFWMKIDNANWFYNKSMYMAFWSPTYLDYARLTDIQESRRLLEKTVTYAQTPLQKKRAQLYLDAFTYYEASAISYWGLKNKRFQIDKKLAETMNKKRYLLVQEFEKNPFLRHVIRFDHGNQFPALKW